MTTRTSERRRQVLPTGAAVAAPAPAKSKSARTCRTCRSTTSGRSGSQARGYGPPDAVDRRSRRRIDLTAHAAGRFDQGSESARTFFSPGPIMLYSCPTAALVGHRPAHTGGRTPYQGPRGANSGREGAAGRVAAPIRAPRNGRFSCVHEHEISITAVQRARRCHEPPASPSTEVGDRRGTVLIARRARSWPPWPFCKTQPKLAAPVFAPPRRNGAPRRTDGPGGGHRGAQRGGGGVGRGARC